MVKELEAVLRQRFQPVFLRIEDASAAHAGHAGQLQSGGGHYRVQIVSAVFSGVGRVQRHRLIHEALSGLWPNRIHALAIKVWAPAEWDAQAGSE